VLTGAYVTVSNYPGTTVEVSRGKGRLAGTDVGVVDTPGMYRLLPITEEESVARRILLNERTRTVVHVADAKNLRRMLPMTLQLIEAGLPVVLDVNLMDEADRLGLSVNVAALEQALGVPVVGTALARGRGTFQLKERLAAQLQGESSSDSACCADAQAPHPVVHYHHAIEQALEAIEPRLQGAYKLSLRTVSLLLLQNDAEVAALVRAQEGERADEVMTIVRQTQAGFGQPLSYVIARQQQEAAEHILGTVMTLPRRRMSGFAERLSEATMNPLTGIPILLVALLLLYEFVGVLGAQTLVKFLEESVFGAYVNPWVNELLARLIPWPVVRDLFGGDYGIITLGVRYALAIILPIVGTFFIAFSIIEDSGYLPRLAMLIDRVFKRIGLNGRAVIPMVLGLGCDTMATIVTRTLETRRERVISTFLLSLAIPCSAQLGVMLGLLGGRPELLAIWGLIVMGVFLVVGFLAARLMPGERPTFYIELPPLRLPTLGNVVVKTYTRMEWYLREVFPVFIIASVVIWLGQLTGLFDAVVNLLVPLVRWMGLPDQTAVTFLFGFFRRDYGAAGLYDMRESLNAAQLVVATTTITLFVPCVAQFSVTLKERGWKTALAIVAFIFPFAFLVGGVLNLLLKALGLG
jgi:ferrous iron transport protein B